MENESTGCNQPNPECRKFYVTISPVSSRNKWHEERGKRLRRWTIKKLRKTESIWQQNAMWSLFGPWLEQTNSGTFLRKQGSLNMDWVLDNMKKLLLIFKFDNGVLKVLTWERHIWKYLWVKQYKQTGYAFKYSRKKKRWEG